MSTLVLLTFAATLLDPWPQATPREESERSCGVCHGLENQEFLRGIHAAAGLDCTSCHGGRLGVLSLPEAHGEGIVALSSPRTAVAVCGECHADLRRMRLYGLRTDQLSLYGISAHGQRLVEEETADVATCVSCHGAHEILPVSDSRSPVHRLNQVETCDHCHSDPELMERHGLSADVVREFRDSVHGRALEEGNAAAPACSDCHGSHGAVPPGVKEIELVCGNCHSTVQAFYEESEHFRSTNAGTAVECASCHREHHVLQPSSSMFLGDEEGHCASCHGAEDDPALGVARGLHAAVEDLEAMILGAERDLRTASAQGLFLGVEQGYLDESRSLLVRGRALTHTLSIEAMADVLSRGQAMVETTLESLEAKQRGFRDRRIFTAIFFAVSLAFAIALLMYAREVGGRWSRASRREVHDGA